MLSRGKEDGGGELGVQWKSRDWHGGVVTWTGERASSVAIKPTNSTVVRPTYPGRVLWLVCCVLAQVGTHSMNGQGYI